MWYIEVVASQLAPAKRSFRKCIANTSWSHEIRQSFRTTSDEGWGSGTRLAEFHLTVTVPHIYSTCQKSLNKCLTSGCILRLCLPTHWTQFIPHLSSDVCLCLRASTFACVRVCLCVSTCVCVRASVFVCVQNIKHPDAFKCKWSLHLDASFAQGLFRVYMYYTGTRTTWLPHHKPLST